MHARRDGLERYRQTQVQSRTPLELVVMLYDGALQFLGTARDAIARSDVAARREAINRALAVVSELQNTLDLERGGDLAVALDRLYSYVNARLLDAAALNDTAPVDEARRVLAILRDGWTTIAAPPPGGAAR
ncbi:MAG: flagellar export chaperone FliS [Acidobacteria bacterium]|nr:flagellar export chaperone FliS [Acidobacteriota bacterium]